MGRIKGQDKNSTQRKSGNDDLFKNVLYNKVDKATAKVFNRKKCRRSIENSSEAKSSYRAAVLASKKSKLKKKDGVTQSVKSIPSRFLRISDPNKHDDKDDKRLISGKNFRLKSRDEIAKSIAQSSPRLRSNKHYETFDKGTNNNHASYFSLSTAHNPGFSTLKKKSIEPRKLNESKSSKHSKCASIQSGNAISLNKFKMNSLFLKQMKKSTTTTSQKSVEKDRTDKVNLVHFNNDQNHPSRTLRLTVNTTKNNVPLVQINNIMSEMRNPNASTISKHEPLKKHPTREGTSSPGKLSSGNNRSKSRKSPSIEIAVDNERMKLQSLLKKNNQAYDKQAIASYLRKNRLVNV